MTGVNNQELVIRQQSVSGWSFVRPQGTQQKLTVLSNIDEMIKGMQARMVAEVSTMRFALPNYSYLMGPMKKNLDYLNPLITKKVDP